ncbi:hypothetical protein Dred_0856 [Desulforamulus reducens MI-1]|uniref:Uncharacterized protein n=1 Tax=Desulforamulus reducens (strain ATCC BAA-1160 / DSM 100696 / MI-1) TaxID=349161 RepID=A4J2U1_DESRM|nr:hypothetical protein [Desulforamulus reducens]ABO49394.1 hypothetical protein Dred_0856 [Desulforamulus reducens MI-1]
MRKTTLRIESNNLILGKTVLESVPDRINTLKDYAEVWGVLPGTKLLVALVRAGIITEANRNGQAHVIVNSDAYMYSSSFELNLGFAIPPKIFLYGRECVYNAAESNESNIFLSSWVKGIEKRIKNGRILFYKPANTPEGYLAIGLPIEFRKQNPFYHQKDVEDFLSKLLKI